MKIDDMIEKIRLKHPEISKEQLLEKLENAKKRSGGLISDETLFRIIMADLGIVVENKASLNSTLSIKDLVPGLGDVSVVGRVVAIFPVKFFEGKRGKMASLFIVDGTGLVRVVLWNDKTSLVESEVIKVGSLVRLSHAYTREGNSGKVELHVGGKSVVETNPEAIKAEDYPDISQFSTKIGELTHAYTNKRINLVGTVKERYSPSTFKRQNSSMGKVVRFVLNDGTGSIPVVVWNEKVDEIENSLRRGIKLQIVNAKVKKAMGEGIEIHVDSGAYVGEFTGAEKFFKIGDFREGLNHVNVKGEVASKPLLRSVKTSKGEDVKLVVFELKDETGKIWVSAWREHAEIAKTLKIGDKIMIKDAYVKRGFDGQLELSTRASTLFSFS